ncbi:MAG TPA: hypothetical protein VIV40_24450 [Kofleriaceae bacterium]
MKALLLLVLAVAACSEGKKPEQREPERQRRVPDPPSRGVRALPPHAIRADGVGPYKLGATVTQLLDQLPSGPRIMQFALPGVIQRDILRAEEDAILIGTEPQGKATFVSVVRSEIARTEAGIHVGSTRAELERALGAPLEDPERAIDPRVVIPSNFKNARVLIEDDRVAAIVVATEPDRGKQSPAEPREVLVHSVGEELQLVARDADKPLFTMRVPGLVFAAALRNPADGRDDIVAITRSEDAQSKTWSLAAYRLHEGKLQRVTGEPSVLYQLTASNARWIGADVSNLELYLELTGRAESIEVGGLLTTRVGDKIRDIVVITPVTVARKRARLVPHDPIDAGTSDAH